MATTSLKLPEDITQRAASVAVDLFITLHAFKVDAIRKTATAAEKHAGFVAQAKIARKKMLKTGLGYYAYKVHAYLRQRVPGQSESSKYSFIGITAPIPKWWPG
jgi:hypothetical protein